MVPAALLLVGFDFAELLTSLIGFRLKPGEAVIAMLPEPFRGAVIEELPGLRRVMVEQAVEAMPKAVEVWEKARAPEAKVRLARKSTGSLKEDVAARTTKSDAESEDVPESESEDADGRGPE